MTQRLKYGTNKIPTKDRVKYRKDYRRRLKEADPSYFNDYHREYRSRVRKEVFEAYGNKCSCCGETEPLFLTLDHINGGGRAHRKEMGGTSAAMFNDIKRRGFPKEYRILCFNCNCGRARSPDGMCPHSKDLGVKV